jgi:hypothetical protein
MAAAALSLALLVYWGVLGLAALAIGDTGRRTCQRLLLAPAVGIVVTVLPIFWLNRAGLPISRFGVPLTLILLAGSVAVLAWRRPLVPVRHCAPFVAILLAAAVLTGRPILTFGFDWLSVVSIDLTNYGLLAQRVLNHGLLEPPALDALRNGLDSGGFFASTYHLRGVRPGPQLLLAWLASVTPWNVLQVFMPCILAAHLALIGAVTGLVYQTRRHRAAALVAAGLLAVGALVTFATLYQFLGQATGLAVFSALAALLLQPTWSVRPIRRLRLAVLVGLVGAGLVVVYTEVVPIAAIAITACLALGVARRRRPLGPLALVVAGAGVVALVALETHTLAAVRFLLGQGRVGIRSFDVGAGFIVPHLFLPSGLAQMSGLQPLTSPTSEPWLSVSIALGAGFLVLTVVATLRLARRGEPVAFVAGTMLAVGAGLLAGRAAFGLLRLIMLIQPFTLATLALGWSRLGRRRIWWSAALVLLAAGNLAVQASYVTLSRGAGAVAELRNASAQRLPAAFARAVRDAAPARLDLDTANIALARLQALYLDQVPATFLTHDPFYEDMQLYGAPSTAEQDRARFPPEWREPMRRFEEAVAGRRTVLRFPLEDGVDGNAFSAPRSGTTAERVPGGALALTTGSQSILNRRRLGREALPFLIKPYAEVSNHLVFVPSRLGQHYHRFVDRRQVALYQLEGDPQYPGRTMAAVGRHLLFRVVNPGPSVRLALDVSAAFKGDGENRVPPATVIGSAGVPLELLGAGSARALSPPVTPREIDGVAYLAIEMGTDPARIPTARTGLMAIYGQDVGVDNRRLVAFVRDISLVTDAEYAGQSPPRSVQQFPGDLANTALEYSGIYEDGWLAEHAYVRLAWPAGASRLVLRGMRPPDPATSIVPSVVVRLDGREVARQPIETPEFALTIDVPPGPERARIDILVSPLRGLSAPDTRRVGFLLRSVGFEP